MKTLTDFLNENIMESYGYTLIRYGLDEKHKASNSKLADLVEKIMSGKLDIDRTDEFEYLVDNDEDLPGDDGYSATKYCFQEMDIIGGYERYGVVAMKIIGRNVNKVVFSDKFLQKIGLKKYINKF